MASSMSIGRINALTHSGRDGATLVNPESGKIISINEYRWEKHCRGLFELPIAA
jgi:hypothetical protein